MSSLPSGALHALELERLDLKSVLSSDGNLVLLASALLSLSNLDDSLSSSTSNLEIFLSEEGLSANTTSLSGELLVSGTENRWSVESVLETESLGSTLGSLDASSLWIGDNSLDASNSSVSESSLLADSDTIDLDSLGAGDLTLLGDLESLASSDDVLSTSGDASESLSLGRPLSESLSADLSDDLSGWSSLGVDENTLNFSWGSNKDCQGESSTTSLTTLNLDSSEPLSGLVESEVDLLASATLGEFQGHGSLESSLGLLSVDLELSHL